MEYHSGRPGIKGQLENSILKTLSSTKGTQSDVKKGAERLVILGVPEYANDSEWGALYFAQPKAKTNSI